MAARSASPRSVRTRLTKARRLAMVWVSTDAGATLFGRICRAFASVVSRALHHHPHDQPLAVAPSAKFLVFFGADDECCRQARVGIEDVREHRLLGRELGLGDDV